MSVAFCMSGVDMPAPLLGMVYLVFSEVLSTYDGVFNILEGLFDLWNGVFCIWDGVFRIWDGVYWYEYGIMAFVIVYLSFEIGLFGILWKDGTLTLGGTNSIISNISNIGDGVFGIQWST